MVGLAFSLFLVFISLSCNVRSWPLNGLALDDTLWRELITGIVLAAPPQNQRFGYKSPQSCHSKIYCDGPILKAIQEGGFFSDSKTFPDMPTKVPEVQVLEAFEAIKRNLSFPVLLRFLEDHFDPVGSDLKLGEAADWKDDIQLLRDLQDKGSDVVKWVTHLHQTWLKLLRSADMSRFVACPTCSSSLIPTRFPMLMPGGRFRESYYWDTYWIMEGLLVSEMPDTARGLLENFMDLIELLGFVPNGNRIYYINRSQPPMFTQMIALYVEHTRDFQILERAMPLLDREYAFWQHERSVHLPSPDGSTKHVLNVYRAHAFGPRPESWAEDVALVAELPDEKKRLVWQQVISATESGWDFSSRWCPLPKELQGDVHIERMGGVMKLPYDLTTLDIVHMVPLDLNALMFSNERLMATLYAYLGEQETDPALREEKRKQVEFYRSAYRSRFEAMKTFLYDTKRSIWGDYNITAKALTRQAFLTDAKGGLPLLNRFPDDDAVKGRFYVSDFAPLWHMDPEWPFQYGASVSGGASESVFRQHWLSLLQTDEDQTMKSELADMHARLLRHVTIKTSAAANGPSSTQLGVVPNDIEGMHRVVWEYAGGIPTSEILSGQQWDFPNAWAPFQLYLVQVLLRKSGSATDPAESVSHYEAAFDIARRWLESTYCGWKRTGAQFEKYNVLEIGDPGGGGEYVVQEGFGWTNGVVLKLLQLFGKEDRLKWPIACDIFTPRSED